MATSYEINPKVSGPSVAVDGDIAVFDHTTGKKIKDGGYTIAAVIAAAGTGNVAGPASAFDGAFALFNGATGKIIKDSAAVPGTGVLTALAVALNAAGGLAPVTSPVFTGPTFGVGTYTSLSGGAITAAGQLLLGAGSSGSYGFQFNPTSGLSAGFTALFQDLTPTTGATKVVLKAGAVVNGNIFETQNSSGSVLVSITTAGIMTIQGAFNSVSGNLTMGAGDFFTFNGRSRIDSPANGNLRLSNNAVNDFNMLLFGGTTSSFPALKRSNAVLQSRLADDSGYATFDAAGYKVGGVAGANFGPGLPTSITVVNGLITAIS